MPINAKNEAQMQLAEAIYQELQAAKIETVLDDRKERAGVKFKDADLIGYPLRITVGPKAVEEDAIEVRTRRTGEVETYGKADYLANVIRALKTL